MWPGILIAFGRDVALFAARLDAWTEIAAPSDHRPINAVLGDDRLAFVWTGRRECLTTVSVFIS
jgi:hypothetical protein